MILTLLFWHITLGLVGLLIHSIIGLLLGEYKIKNVLSFRDLLICIIGGSIIFLIILLMEIDSIRIRKNKVK